MKFRTLQFAKFAIFVAILAALYFFFAARVERNPEKRKRKEKSYIIVGKTYSNSSMDSSAPEATEEMSNSWGTFF